MSEKPIIGFRIQTLGASGGTQRMLTILANRLTKHFEVIIFSGEKIKPFFNLHSEVRVKFLKNTQNIFRDSFTFGLLVRSLKVDYMVFLDANIVLYQSFFIPIKTKIIIWEHFSLVNNFPKIAYKISRYYASLKANRILILSESEKKLWHHKYRASLRKLKVIYNPNTIPFQPKDSVNQYNNRVVLAIGNHIEVKGFDILLKAWKGVAQDWTLYIVGLNNQRRKILQRLAEADNLKNVMILPRTKEIIEIYKKAAIFVLSSRKEATPLVLIEAQTVGLPVVSFNHLSGVKEMMKESVLYADFEKKEVDLIKRINQLIENRRDYDEYHALSLNNAEKFDVDHFIKSWMSIFVP